MGLVHRHGHDAGGLKIEETVACKVLTLLAVMTALLQFLLVVQWGEGMSSVERARIHQMEGYLAQVRGSASQAAGDSIELDGTMVVGDEAGRARPEDAGRGGRGRGGAYNSHHDGKGILGDLADEWFGGGSDKAGYEASVSSRSYDAMMHDDPCRQGGAEEEDGAEGPHPLRGPEFGGTRVVFPLEAESNVHVGTDAACRFGELSVVGTVIARGRGKAVECRSPAQTYVFRAGDSLRAVASSLGVSVNHLSSVNSEIKDLNKVFVGQKINVIPPSVPLALSINGISHTSSSRVFTFETLALHSASPRGSPHPGGALLSIRGEGFRRPSRDGCDCRCRFRATDGGSVTVPARYISSSLVICIVPPANVLGAHGGVISVELTTNGADYTESGLTHAYIKQTICLPAHIPATPPLPIEVVSFAGKNTHILAGAVSSWKALKAVSKVSVAGQGEKLEATLKDSGAVYVPLTAGELQSESGSMDESLGTTSLLDAADLGTREGDKGTVIIARGESGVLLTDDVILAVGHASAKLGTDTIVLGCATFLESRLAAAAARGLKGGGWQRDLRGEAVEKGHVSCENGVHFISISRSRAKSWAHLSSRGDKGAQSLTRLLWDAIKEGAHVVDATPSVVAIVAADKNGAAADKNGVARDWQRLRGAASLAAWTLERCPDVPLRQEL